MIRIYRRYQSVFWPMAIYTLAAVILALEPGERGYAEPKQIITRSIVCAALVAVYRLLYKKDFQTKTNRMLMEAGYYRAFAHLHGFILLLPVLILAGLILHPQIGTYLAGLQAVGAIHTVYNLMKVGMRARADRKEQEELEES